MAKKLTDKGIERMKHPAHRREDADLVTPGLYLIVQPSGRKSWGVRTRLAGKPFKYTIGSFPAYGVASARAEARKVLAMASRGEDPRVARKREKTNTVKAVVADWLKKDQSRNRGHDVVKRMFDRHVLPRWSSRPVQSIRRADCHAVIDAIAARGTVIHARRVHAHLHRFLAWCAEQELVDANPMAGMKKPGGRNAERARDRVLSDAELAKVWRAAESMGWPFGRVVQLLALTGARRSEIVELRWSEIVEDSIMLSAERTKTDEPRSIPLSATARQIVADLPHLGRTAYVFVTRKKPVSGWSKAKTSLDKLSGVKGWRLHDLRRTVATGLQRLGHRLEVIEAVLGHTSGSRAGIVGVYQRHRFEPEKQEALEEWATHIGTVLKAEDSHDAELRSTAPRHRRRASARRSSRSARSVSTPTTRTASQRSTSDPR